MPLLPWRKFIAGLSGEGTVKDMGSVVQHITNISETYTTQYTTINVNSELPALTLNQTGSGITLLLRHDTQPELRFEEGDQVDPLGRFRFLGTAGGFYLQAAKTEEWATATEILSYVPSSKSVTLAANAGVDWYTIVGAGGAAGENSFIKLGGSGAGSNVGIRFVTGDGAGGNIQRLLIAMDAAQVVATWSYVTHSGFALAGELAANAKAIRNLLYLELGETSTPSATASRGKLYTKDDNLLYFQSGDGVEHAIAYA